VNTKKELEAYLKRISDKPEHTRLTISNKYMINLVKMAIKGMEVEGR